VLLVAAGCVDLLLVGGVGDESLSADWLGCGGEGSMSDAAAVVGGVSARGNNWRVAGEGGRGELSRRLVTEVRMAGGDERLRFGVLGALGGRGGKRGVGRVSSTGFISRSTSLSSSLLLSSSLFDGVDSVARAEGGLCTVGWLEVESEGGRRASWKT
jgi:hypothetical protein